MGKRSYLWWFSKVLQSPFVSIKYMYWFRNPKRARNTPPSAGCHLSPHRRQAVWGDGPEALPQEWCTISGSRQSEAREKCKSCHFCFSQRSESFEFLMRNENQLHSAGDSKKCLYILLSCRIVTLSEPAVVQSSCPVLPPVFLHPLCPPIKQVALINTE